MVTPHAAFLALPYAPARRSPTWRKLKTNFDAYGPGGFYDAVAVRSGTVAQALPGRSTRRWCWARSATSSARTTSAASFVTPQFEHALRPLLAQETFNVPPTSALPQLRAARP